MPKNLLIITYEEFPSFIGLSTRIKGISQSLMQSEFKVEIVAPFYSNKFKIPQRFFRKVKIHNIKMPNLFGKFKLAIISRLLFMLLYTIRVLHYFGKHKEKFEFVQSEQIYPFWSSYILSKKFRAKVILDEPTIFEDIISHKLKKIKPLSYMMKKIVNRFEFIVYKISNIIICSSKKTLLYVENIVKSKGNKLYYLPNGVDTNEFKFHVKPNFGNRIFFNCSLPYYQNLAALGNLIKIIEYFEENSFSNYFVQIVVNNKNFIPNKLKDIVKSNDKVSFLSEVDSLVLYIYASDMVVLPYEQGHFSNAGARLKALEALSCGKVVLSTLEGIDGLSGCIDGENIIICSDWIDMAKKIIDLISQNNKSYQIKKLQENAHHLVEENYSWNKLIKFYYNF